MEYATEVKVAVITLWNYLAIIVNVIAFGILYMKASKNRSLKAFFLVQLSMLLWLIGKVFKTVSPTEEIRWFFIVFYYFGICLLEVSFFDFSYIYYKGRALKGKFRLLIYMVGFVEFIIVCTNPMHYLFYSRYSFWGDEFGILFYVHVLINYIFILVGMIWCSKKFKEQLTEKTRFEKNLISIAIVAPIVMNFIYITRLLEAAFEYFSIQIFDITPIVYTWSLLIFVYATFRYEFFSVSPIMKHEITSRLDTPIMITDENHTVLYVNKKFHQIFGEQLDVSMKDQSDEIIRFQGKFYKQTVNDADKMGKAKYIFTYNDITNYQMINNALMVENEVLQETKEKLENQITMLKQTSYIGAKNFVARELHDIIGHSLVVTMKLLEVSKLSCKHNKQHAKESLKKAVTAVTGGVREVKMIKDKEVDIIYTTPLLEKEIRTMLKTVDVSGVKTNFYFRGNKQVIEDKYFDIIKKISTELVTNTLKHSGASQLFLSIVISKEKIVLQMMDNGKGAKNLVKGNGLSGIDGRLSLIGGKAKYTTNKGEGFAAGIDIPLLVRD